MADLRDLGGYIAVQRDGCRVELDGPRQIDFAVNNLDPGQVLLDDHTTNAGVNNLARDQRCTDAQRRSVPRNILPPANPESTPNAHASAATNSDPGHCSHEARIRPAGADLHDAILLVLADALDDLERVRIATENRVRSLSQVKGLGGSRFERHLTDLQAALAALEHKAELDLQRAMRLHPLYGFVKQTRGLGEKQAARLLAAIGNPADRPNPAKLWQYCGHGDPARSRLRRGERVEFSPTAKMRVHLCAEKIVQAGVRKLDDCDDGNGYDLLHRVALSPLGWKYLAERKKWADRDTSDGHKHAHALRVVGKELLKDLWRYSRGVAA